MELDYPSRDMCVLNEQCWNKACGRLHPLSAHKICCPGNKSINIGGYDYCGNLPSGSACYYDGVCASGHCSDRTIFNSIGKCD